MKSTVITPFEQKVWENCTNIFHEGWKAATRKSYESFTHCKFCFLASKDDFTSEDEWLDHLTSCSIKCGFPNCHSWLAALFYLSKKNSILHTALVDYLESVFQGRHEEHLIIIMRCEHLKYDTIISFQEQVEAQMEPTKRWKLPLFYISYKMKTISLAQFLTFVLQEDYHYTFRELMHQHADTINASMFRYDVLAFGAVRIYHRNFIEQPQFELDLYLAKEIRESMQLRKMLHRLQQEVIVLTNDLVEQKCDKHLYNVQPEYIDKVSAIIAYLEVMTKRLFHKTANDSTILLSAWSIR